MGNSRLRGAMVTSLLFIWGCGASNTGGQNTGSGGSSASGGAGGINVGTGGGGGGSSGGGGGGGSGNGGSAGSGGSGGTGTGSGGTGTGTGGTSAGGAGGGAGGGTGPVTVQLDKPDQTIEGFGINDMYQSTALPASLFDPSAGIGLSILRVGMDTNGQGNLQSPTSMNADITTVNAAGGKVIGSVWTPPAGCKTNQNANNGGQLCAANNVATGGASMCTANENSTCYNSWATTITNFATTNHLYAMSLSNEPEFASCGTNEPCNGTYATAVYTANEMAAFVRVAGPMLKAKGIKVIAPETSEWNHLWGNKSACGSVPSGLKSSDPLNCGCFISNSSTPSATCVAAAAVACSSACTSGNGYDYGHALHADSTAWSNLDIIGTHEYDSQTAFPWPTSDFPKDKEVWMTEMAGVKWWAEQGPTNDINDGVVVATWIHSALVTGEASAWLWWWYPGQSDNEGLLAMNGDSKRHYTLGNFSKFVRPGYVRLNLSGGSPPANVLLSAYSGSNTVVVVAINSGTSTLSVPISITGGTAPASCTPWLTSANANLTSQTAVPVSGGSFTAALAGPSVTTFVCK